MMDAQDLRVAWLFPSLALGNYWHPVLSKFAEVYPQTTVFTGNWPGFSPGFENAFTVRAVGKMTFVDTTKSQTGYNQGFIQASPAIASELLRFKPNVIFTSGFSIWTIFALLLKPLNNWRVVIVYDGSSPIVDYRDAKIRTWLRRLMSRFTDAFITNSHTGKAYLTKFLGIDPPIVFARPYQVPDTTALLKQTTEVNLNVDSLPRPIFLFTGQVIPRKGVVQLLQACKILRDRGYSSYTLLIAGDGEQHQELKTFCQLEGLTDCVQWLGWVNYGQLGAYFRSVDAFILPTLEDVWGMVVLEAMTFGKPILCSQWAGASEMVIEGENGFLFDPNQPDEIATAMAQLINHPELIHCMGERSQEFISDHTPAAAAEFLSKVTDFVVKAQ